MAMYYFDTSAIVKYFHHEPGTDWVVELVDRRSNGSERPNPIYMGEITRVEVPAAFAILARLGQIDSRTRNALYGSFLQKAESAFQFISLTPAIIRRAAELTLAHPLKAYDAVQLAIALGLQRELIQAELTLIFVSGDRTLIRAALAEGLPIENPYDHAD